jgi:hypothetical protein
MEVMLGMQEQFQVRGNDDGEVKLLLVVELTMLAYEPNRREKQAKRFAAHYISRTVVDGSRNPVKNEYHGSLDSDPRRGDEPLGKCYGCRWPLILGVRHVESLRY